MWSWYRRQRRRHKKAFTLIELMIAIAIIGSIASLAVVKYENFVCHAQEQEARVALQNIYQVETQIFSEFDAYDPLPVCTFGYIGFVCVGPHIIIEFPGRSRYSYNVDNATATTFLAHATGTSGHVVGDAITIDQNGKLDLSASVCGSAP